MSKRTSAAYDLSRFEPSTDVKKRPEIKRVARKKPINYISPFKIVVVLLCLVIATASILFTRAQITEVNAGINELSNQYDEALSEEVRLEMEMEQNMSLEQISEYAKNNLGMIEAGKSHIHAFTLSNENRIEIKKETEFSLFRSIEDFFSKVKEYITG